MSEPSQEKTIYDFTVKALDGSEVSMEKYRGHPLLIVNVASNCGFTRNNYQQLNQLHSKYKDRGLKIVGFPCNQFLNQEPGCATDIVEFLQKNQVEFEVMDKIDVNGANVHPLYGFLKEKQPGFLFGAIKWNFTKFLVDPAGNPVSRYAPTTGPNDIAGDIERFLG